MSKYFMPLKVFIGGQFGLLLMWLVLPDIGAAGTTLAATPHASTFWGMIFAAVSIRLIVVIIGELFVIGIALFTFLKAKS
jgi:hypothetical protein